MNIDEIIETLEYKLVSAASNNDLKKVKSIIGAGVDVSSHEGLYGRTALHAACSQALTKMVPYLIKAGASLNSLDNKGMTPLMHACHEGKKKGSAIAMMLMDAGADVTYIREEDDMSALSFAHWGKCSNEVITRLVDMGAPPLEDDFENIHVT